METENGKMGKFSNTLTMENLLYRTAATGYRTSPYPLFCWYRVGGGVIPAVLPHHRTYGSVYGGSYNTLKFTVVIKQRHKS